LAKTDSVAFRNNNNDGDLLLAIDSSNALTFNGAGFASSALTSGHVFIGSSLNVATDRALTGDLAITNAGVTAVNSVQAGVITNAMVNAAAAIAFSKLAALTVSRALASDGSGIVSVSATTSTELGYLAGVTSAVQTQLDSKLALAGGTMSGALILGNVAPATFTASATTGGTLTAGTYYYKVWPVFGSLIGAPSRERSVVISGGNSASSLAWAAVSGTTTYRVSRGSAQGSCDGYYTVSGTSYTDTNASFTGSGNPFSQTTTQWGATGGNLLMPGSSGGIYFQSWLDGSIVSNIGLTSADEMQYVTGTSGSHIFIDVNNHSIARISRTSSHSEISAWSTSDALGDLDLTYGTSLNIRPSNSTKWTFNTNSLLTPSGAAATPALDLNSEHTGLYLGSAGVMAVSIVGTNRYNFLDSALRPAGNNTQDLGSSSAKWANVYAGTQLINTATTNQLLFGTTNTTTVSFTAPSASRVYTVPDAGGAANFLLSGSGQIVNADINASAAIAYSKLALTGSVVNADIGASAAIAYSKLASLTSAHILVGSAGNVATDVAMSGEVSITNAGVTALATTIANAHTFSGQITFSNTSGQLIHGNSASPAIPAAGNIGEVIESKAPGPTNFPTTSQFGDLTSITLTAGVWRIDGLVFAGANGATVTQFVGGVSTTTGNSGTGLVNGDTAQNQTGPTGVANTSVCLSGIIVTPSTSTTYYLKYLASYSVATPQASGRITATRIA
jgi:hypothetical protein